MPTLLSWQDHYMSNVSVTTTIGSTIATFATGTARIVDEPRLGVGLAILFVSLFAVSFPSLSKHISFIRIPGILFFVGKHFGTGVILATAFIHLLDDAFKSLQSKEVERRYGTIGKFTGLIIMVSLLSIFLVEYISTSYVEHLQEKPSAPPTPESSRPGSPSPRQTVRDQHSRSRNRQHTSRSRSRTHAKIHNLSHEPPTETTPLISSDIPINPSITRAPSAPVLPAYAHTPSLTTSHYHTHAAHHPHHHHHAHTPSIPPSAVIGLPIEVLTNSPRICRLALAHDHVHGHHHHVCKIGLVDDPHLAVLEEDGEETHVREHAHTHEEAHEHAPHHPVIGRRRQVIGLLVLQLGIMIHSLVIGLTLSVTSGADFTSLTTAIIFHQLFEGLSLGIRIAALPPSKKDESTHLEDVHDSTSSAIVDEWEQNSERLFSDDSNNHLSANVDHDNPQVRTDDTVTAKRCRSIHSHDEDVVPTIMKPHHSRLQSPALSAPRRWLWTLKSVQWLKPTLTLLFGVTTPFGMLLGMIVWKSRGNSGDEGSMLLIQGVMSAISAGMLIYAATVEMIAADFVFGDVEGHHHHHHHHAHGDEYHGDGDGNSGGSEDGRSRPSVNTGGKNSSSANAGDEPKKNTTLRKRALAIFSLFAGASMMVLVGLGE